MIEECSHIKIFEEAKLRKMFPSLVWSCVKCGALGVESCSSSYIYKSAELIKLLEEGETNDCI